MCWSIGDFLIYFLMSASAALLFELCGNMPIAH